MRNETEEEKAVRSLQKMIRHRTLSDAEPEVFQAFHRELTELFPRVFSGSETHTVQDKALLIRLKGKSDERPLLFLSHMDVVPALFENEWTCPPFEGQVTGGYIYGRGTLDMKGHLCALLCAAEALLSDGWVPGNDIWFALSADEEKRGGTMRMMCSMLSSYGVSPAFVLDEGGFVTEFSRYHKQPAALVGVAEKGRVNFTLSARADVGAERLIKAASRMSSIRFKPRLTDTVSETLRELSPCSVRPMRFVSKRLSRRAAKHTAVRMLSSSVYDRDLVTSVVALQSMKGDALDYQKPSLTYAASLLHGDQARSFVRLVQKKLMRDGIDISIDMIEDPSLISPTEGPAWEAVKTAINMTFPHVPVAPALVLGATDARRMEIICPYIYRFSPFDVPRSEKMRIHGIDERISIANLTRGIQFFKTLLQA